ncbi:hypothetical protein N752_22605 [Desulforamulus aquiferis]|nr:hypothetical protein N752_22605 [Desulforamulus aquiferis]
MEFAILYCLLILAILARGKLTARGNILAVGISVAYAFIDEFHQFFIPSRSATLIDIVKDLIGIAIAWYFVRQVYFKNTDSRIGQLLKGFTDKVARKDEEYKTGR